MGAHWGSGNSVLHRFALGPPLAVIPSAAYPVPHVNHMEPDQQRRLCVDLEQELVNYRNALKMQLQNVNRAQALIASIRSSQSLNGGYYGVMVAGSSEDSEGTACNASADAAAAPSDSRTQRYASAISPELTAARLLRCQCASPHSHTQRNRHPPQRTLAPRAAEASHRTPQRHGHRLSIARHHRTPHWRCASVATVRVPSLKP